MMSSVTVKLLEAEWFEIISIVKTYMEQNDDEQYMDYVRHIIEEIERQVEEG